MAKTNPEAKLVRLLSWLKRPTVSITNAHHICLCVHIVLNACVVWKYFSNISWLFSFQEQSCSKRNTQRLLFHWFGFFLIQAWMCWHAGVKRHSAGFALAFCIPPRPLSTVAPEDTTNHVRRLAVLIKHSLSMPLNLGKWQTIGRKESPTPTYSSRTPTCTTHWTECQ